MKSNYTPIIGLEIHAELSTNSKMFCGCENDPFHAKEPNSHTCPVCLGMPGGLPVPNKKAIDWTYMLGFALDCIPHKFSKFDRKHYFYPDLPKGYQISQYEIPFCHSGKLETNDGVVKLTRIHLEEDTGKLLHKTIDGKKVTLVDFNRSGVPLVEIVSEPDIHSASQAKEFAKKIRGILTFLEVADCDMEKGGMRLEANISLMKQGSSQLPNYKVEIKNINSFRFLEQAINYEVERQTDLLKKGEVPIQETRGWNANSNKSYSQRTKEEAQDYRYFPEPDIPPIQYSKNEIKQIKDSLVELPATIVKRWQTDLSVEPRFSQQLLATQEQADLMNKIFSLAKKEGLDPNKIANAAVNKKIKIKKDETPQQVISKFKSLSRTDDVDQEELENTVKEVLAEHLDAVTKYKAGKTQVIGFLIGQVTRKLQKKVDINQLKNIIQEQLS